MNALPKRALVSVSDKTGLAPFARGLADLGFQIISTGGTRRFLEENAIPVIDISSYTGFPEIMDGRVKTLHPKVHGAILGRPDLPADAAAIRDHGIVPFQVVVCNLYPVRENRRPAGRLAGRGDRANRRRRTKHGSRGSEEPCLRGGRHRPRSISGRAGAASGRTHLSRISPATGAGRIRANGHLRSGHRRLPHVANGRRWRAKTSRFPAQLSLASQAGGPASLRRESPSGGGLIRRADGPSVDSGPGENPPRQGALVQQPARPRRGPRTGPRVHRPGGRRHQAQQPVRLCPRQIALRGIRQSPRRRSGERVRFGCRIQPPARCGHCRTA